MTPVQRARWFRKKVKTHVRNSRLSVEARLLWLILESYANMDGTSCHPSVATLMKDTGRSKKWVEKYLKELKGASRIFIRKKQTAAGWVNLYEIRYELTCDYSGRGLPPNSTQGVGSKNDPLPGIKGPEPSYSPPETVREEPAIIRFPRAATA